MNTIDLKEKLTDDPLKNIFIMAPYLDEKSQYKLVGFIAGIMGMPDGVKENSAKGAG